jgi:uncharacterized spore protein YtfJ
MAVHELMRDVEQTVTSSASVKNIFGEPIQHNGRTVIPVARVAYGFGGGGGSGSGKLPQGEGEGGGAGVGVVALPVGVVDISDEATRYISFAQERKLLGAFAIGALAGMFFLRWKR